jgi:murein DD-endopeptidase MepM/ murein hydrolase activator NlpD
VRPYPLDSLRGVQGLLLQNVAIINRGQLPIALDRVAIQLRAGSAVIDERRFGPDQIASAAKSGSGAKAQGLMELAAFQFCDGQLLAGAAVGNSGTLQPGEALLLMQNVFAYKGTRSDVNIEVVGRAGAAAVGASTVIPIDSTSSKTEFRWPLSGKRTWLVGSGASFHTTHRWAVPEEFALDIIAVDGSGSTYRGRGTKNGDFFAYGADVVAAADGIVVQTISGVPDASPMLRGLTESMEAYYGRIGEQQAANMSKGEQGISGNAVVIDHGNGEYSIYAHLAPGSIAVRKGDQVAAGQRIGKLGSSGNSTEPHLHFQVCDRPSTLSCAAIPPTFGGTTVLNADGPRPIQSGDLVKAR